MKKMEQLKYYWDNPMELFFRVGRNTFLKMMSDERYLKLLFKHTMGYPLDLDNPQTYNEKLNWIKLHDRKKIYTTMVDKYEAKKYVASIIGEEYIIPTLGVWDNFDDIDFDALPSQFILKCTHDSGGLVVCKDKSNLNLIDAKKKINRSLKANYFWLGREWPYKNVKPRIIAEKYMTEHKPDEKCKMAEKILPLNDYKFYTMNGTVKAMMIVTDRGVSTKADYFDRDFCHMDFTWGYPNATTCPAKPRNFDKMIYLAEQLAAGTTEVRVDFYEVDGKLYFGELTFFDGCGMQPILPLEWDYKLGSWMNLNNKN